MFGLGLPEIAIMTVVALLVFGPSKLPQLGRSLGGAINNFKTAIAGKEEEDRNSKKLS